jgi:prepilin-type N-terminal cleavage/methylation domain-containing protein
MKPITLRYSQHGFSLVELLIALLIMGVVTTAVFKTYINQHENYLIQEDVSVIQQSARASIDELSRQIRMAGFGLPVGLDPIVASNTNPDTITIRYQSSDCDTWLTAPMPQPSAELKCNDVSCFSNDSWVYIFEPDSGGGEFFLITQVQTGSSHLQHNTMTLSRKYGEDAIILEMYEAKFYIDESDTAHPNLMILLPGQAPAVYAENISDLQFRYRLKNGLVVDAPPLVEDVRQVMIDVVGRSSDAVVTANQGNSHRFRTYTSSVNLRNTGIGES